MGILVLKSKCKYIIILCVLLFLTGCYSNNGRTNKSIDVVTNLSSSKVKRLVKAEEPFGPIEDKLLKIYSFPIMLPTYLPKPEVGKRWRISPEFGTDAFEIEINQHQIGYTGEGHPIVNWYGIISGNIGKPSENPVEKQFKSDNIQSRPINLHNGIVGKEYIKYPSAFGGTAIAWETNNWSFFVQAGPEDSSGSASNFANQVIDIIENSGQVMPGLQGKFYFLYSGNMPLTEIYWEVENGVWYKLEWKGLDEAIKILQSMVIV